MKQIEVQITHTRRVQESLKADIVVPGKDKHQAPIPLMKNFGHFNAI